VCARGGGAGRWDREGELSSLKVWPEAFARRRFTHEGEEGADGVGLEVVQYGG
jgi:hypothetical protein